jgi:hypothetical protein
MTNTELWLTYHMVSRVCTGKPTTAQLIELEFQNNKLVDLEDVLDHVFRQGFVDPKHRPSTWWEKKDGNKVKGSQSVEDLLKQGVGRCQDTALKLVIEDVPPAIWFSYVYLHNAVTPAVTQRIKFDAHVQLEKLAHVTNHVFGEGYLPAKFRTVVHWEGVCGKPILESATLADVLSWGEGVSENKAIRLVIDDAPHTHHDIHTPATSRCSHAHRGTPCN